jgi:hypothetical protein
MFCDFLSDFGSIIGSLLGGLISFLIALETIQRNRSVKKDEENDRLKQLEQLFYLMIGKLRIGLEHQIANIDKVIDTLQKDLESDPLVSDYRAIKLFSAINPEPLLKIHFEDIFKFYVLASPRNKKEERQNLFSNLSFSIFTLQKVIDYIDRQSEIGDNYFQLHKRFYDTLRGIDKIAIQHVTHDNSETFDPFIISVYSIRLESMKKGDRTITAIINSFIDPCKEICSKEEFFSYPGYKVVQPMLMDLTSIVGEVVGLKNKQISHFRDYKSMLTPVLENVNQIADKRSN